MTVPKSHPRYLSLATRDKIVSGVERGVTSIHGLIAQGRGEAFDYLIGERTNDFAKKAIDAAIAMLLLAKNPVISVNGNVAALASKEIVDLSQNIGAKIEVNIFHSSKRREKVIKKELRIAGAKKVFLPSKRHKIDHIDHNRKFVSKEGILTADVVFVPLEDGDRCEALVRNGKKVITVDLNPKSRTARTANISIVDNLTRAVKVMNSRVTQLKKKQRKALIRIVNNYDNENILKLANQKIKNNF